MLEPGVDEHRDACSGRRSAGRVRRLATLLGRQSAGRYRRWWRFALCLCISIAACGKSAPPPAKPTAAKVALTGANGAVQITVWREPDRLRIEALDGEEALRITGLDIGRERRYQNPRVPLLRARERAPGELVLLDLRGTIVWRLRLSSSSVRIARGDRTGAALFLAMNRLGHVAARRETTSFGSVVPGPRNEGLRARRADGTVVLEAPGNISPLALGALLLKDLPAEDRLIIFAELLRR